MQINLLCMKFLQDGLSEIAIQASHMSMLKTCLHFDSTQEGGPINDLQDSLQYISRLSGRESRVHTYARAIEITPVGTHATQGTVNLPGTLHNLAGCMQVLPDVPLEAPCLQPGLQAG